MKKGLLFFWTALFLLYPTPINSYHEEIIHLLQQNQQTNELTAIISLVEYSIVLVIFFIIIERIHLLNHDVIYEVNKNSEAVIIDGSKEVL